MGTEGYKRSTTPANSLAMTLQSRNHLLLTLADDPPKVLHPLQFLLGRRLPVSIAG